MAMRWAGIFNIMATPFTADGRLDQAGIPLLADRLLGAGVQGLTILGIAGEAHRLSDAERQRVVERVVKEVGGRVPVVVGTGAGGTDQAILLSRMAQDAGASALMVAPPPRVSNQDWIREYYQALAAATTVPLVLQDEPVTTQVPMPAAFLAQLAAEVPRVEAVKLEDAPTPPKVSRLKALAGDRVAIFGGLGGVFFLEELFRGAAGAMTGFAYPEILLEVYEHFTAGRRRRAIEVFYRYLPIIRFEGQPGATPGTGVGIRKEILRRRGWLRTAHVRPPAPKLDPGTLDELSEMMEVLGLGPEYRREE
jgi:4-hydroxy-tetrahydrodipicolinate synthase